MSEKAYLEKYTNKTGFVVTRLVRGKLNDGDKHWGKRSNMNFRKILETKTKEAGKK